MDAYIQTALGIVVSVVLFLFGYKQTIGARKERVRAANKAIHRALLRRMVLEEYKPKVKDIGRILEGKANEFQVTAEDLHSEEQVLTNIFTEVFDNDFIAPTQRVSIEQRVDEVFDEIIREKEPAKKDEPVFTDVQARKNIFMMTMGIATSLVGATTAFLYTLTKERLVPSAIELSDMKLLLPVIGVFLGSLVAVAAISFLKRTRETTDEIEKSKRVTQIEGMQLEKEIVSVLLKLGLDYQVEPTSGGLRPDFIIQVHNKKIAIEAKAWHSTPPLHFIARVRDYAKEILMNKAADEVLIVTKARLPIADNLSNEEGIRFVTVKELANYLQQRTAQQKVAADAARPRR